MAYTNAKKYNNCDPEQRKRCEKAIKMKNKDLIIKELNKLLFNLEIDNKNCV